MFGFLALAPTPLSSPTPPAAVELVWDAPKECPTGADVESLFEALLTSEPAGSGVLEAHAIVTHTDDGAWGLELTTRIDDYTDVRKIRGATCQDLADAAATLFAFALEPALHTPEPEAVVGPAPEPEPEPEPEPRPQPPVPQITPEAPQPPRHHRLFATVSAGPEIGATPSVTARITAGLGVGWRWARFEADVAWLAPRPTPARLGGARVQSVVGLVRGCGLPGGDIWRFPVCAGVEVGATIARTDRGSGQETISGVRAGPMLSAGAVRRFNRLGLFLSVEGVGAVVRSEIRLANAAIYSPANGSARMLAGLEIGFF
ncbi:MAG: hypothetical protein KUG77_09245 [Nannocystaceae bacterium]|nr:hypothetical protein [Nannocystaceae bacterium]